jgi:hypothetical protein
METLFVNLLILEIQILDYDKYELSRKQSTKMFVSHGGKPDDQLLKCLGFKVAHSVDINSISKKKVCTKMQSLQGILTPPQFNPSELIKNFRY